MRGSTRVLFNSRIEHYLFFLKPKLQVSSYLSRPMGKPTICIGENKGADQLRGNREADQRVFATQKVQFLFFLNPKFQASSSFLCLYSPVCVRPVRKPHCWFSQEVAHLLWLCRLVWEGNPKTVFLASPLIYTKSESVPVIELIETCYSRYCSDHRETCCPVDRWEIPPTGQ